MENSFKVLVLLWSFLFLYTTVCYGLKSEDLLTTGYEWKYIDYVWDSDEQKQKAIDSGNYIASAPFLVDVDIAIDGRVFVTMLRTKGVPATLGIVTGEIGEGGPLVRPFPDWKSHEDTDCRGILNVYRIAIDKCNQLWILDAGTVEHEYKCPAKLIVIDLSTDIIVRTIEIPRDAYKGTLVAPTVYYLDDSCLDPTVFMADIYDSAVTIYDGKNFCSFESKSFASNPNAITFTVDGQSAEVDVGVLSMALTNRLNKNTNENDVILYYRPLASYELSWINADELRNYCKTSKKPNPVTFPQPMTDRGVAIAITNGVLFYGGVENTTLNCYNTREEFTASNQVTLIQDTERLQWATGVKIYPQGADRKQQLAVLTDRYQKVKTNTIDINEVNYRILFGEVDELIAETKCAIF